MPVLEVVLPPTGAGDGATVGVGTELEGAGVVAPLPEPVAEVVLPPIGAIDRGI